MEPTKEEKKRHKELEIEWTNHINNIMRMRANYPPYHYKGTPNKVHCYETIENVAYGKIDAFKKTPKRSYSIEDTYFYKLDFPFNCSMFTFGQFNLAENFHDTKEKKKV